MGNFSLHRVMTLTVLGLGALGMLLVFGAGLAYRQLAFDNQSEALRQLIATNSKIVLDRTIETAADLGHSIQKESDLEKEPTSTDHASLSENLDQHFHRYFVTLGMLDLQHLHILDLQHQIIASASRSGDNTNLETRYCPYALEISKNRAGAERLQTLASLCRVGSHAFLTVIVPIGGLKPIGFLVLVIDPVPNFAHMETNMGKPIKVIVGDDLTANSAYQSKNWPNKQFRENWLVGHHEISATNSDETVLTIESADSLVEFNLGLAKTHSAIGIASIALIAIGLVIAIKIMRAGMIDLAQLQEAAEALAEGRYKTLRNARYKEIRGLTKSFNRMSLQIRMHHEHLNELVSMRTRELEAANAKLGADIDRRKELDRAKDEFIAVINHEMRTPVTAIKGALDLLECGKLAPLPEQLKSLVTIARKNCGRLLRLISDVLNVQHLEEGSFTFELEPTLLAPLVKHAVATIQPFADSYDVTIKVTDFFPGTYVKVDRDRLIQVFTNLLSNAAKYTNRKDQIEVIIDQHRNFARVSIIDHGPGIPATFQNKLFQKFSQANVTNTRSTGSSGLGLYITKQLVEGMHGNIDFETEENCGTSFFVDFPVVPGKLQHGSDSQMNDSKKETEIENSAM